jgi:hypothetical protein
MANDSWVSAAFVHFNAHVIADPEINYTIVGGRFSPTIRIDLTSQVVILALEGANDFRLCVSADSFKKNGLGGYVARVKRRLFKTDILLQPSTGGDWAYSASIEGFAPGSRTVTVSLRIGNQAGMTTGQVFALRPNADRVKPGFDEDAVGQKQRGNATKGVI